jgi:uncharacterized protein YqhQ
MAEQEPKFNYGGQAVIEGVMMRGSQIAAVAVRDPEQNVVIHEERLNSALYRGRIGKIPFVRGLVGLWDALVLGMRALIWSANIALIEEEEPPKQDTGRKGGLFGGVPFIGKTLTVLSYSLRTLPSTLGMAFDGGNRADPIPPTDPSPTEPEAPKSRADHENAFSDVAVVGLVATSLTMSVGLFLVLPAVLSDLAGTALGSDSRLLKDTIEAVVKLALFIGYIAAIGMMEDVKRLFGYHGAEHKTINAYEADAELIPGEVQKHSIEHPRCGTAFLLMVIVFSVVAHAITGRPDNFFLLILSRIVATPLVAGMAYEFIKFTAKHSENPIIQAIIIPNLMLQHLTTRQPDDSMVEVAIHALERVIEAEEAVQRGESIAPQNEIIIPATPAASGAD